MGGYGGYVWSAFGFALISMGGLLWQSWRAQARRSEELKSLRSTIRGSSDLSERRTRRLVATRPDSEPDADNLASPGSASGR
jgi:heme exporter protein CcmD